MPKRPKRNTVEPDLALPDRDLQSELVAEEEIARSRELELHHCLLLAASHLEKLADQFLAQHDLSYAQYRLLSIMGEVPELPQVVVSRILKVNRANVTFLVHKLKEKGWIERRTLKDDLRVNMISLTEHGAKRLEAIRPGFARMLQGVLPRMTADERRIAHHFLYRILQAQEA